MIALLVIILEANSLSCYSLLTLQSLIQLTIKIMKIDFNNLTAQNTILTLLFYVSIIITVAILNQYSPSGPCNPGLGILLLMFVLFLMTPILFVINFNKTKKGDKTNRYSALIHFIVLISFAVLFVLLNFGVIT